MDCFRLGAGDFLRGSGRGWNQGLKNAPPIPAQVVTTDGRVLFDGATIQDGQGVWQSIGGQEVGTVWGHGAYVAPDWSADWLHRECVFILDHWAKESGAANYAALGLEQQAALQARLQQVMRTTPTIAVPADHPRSGPRRRIRGTYRHYADVFSRGRDDMPSSATP